MLGPHSGIHIDWCQECCIDRHTFIFSTVSSREVDWPLLRKTGITSATGCCLTSNWWHWKANLKIYLVWKYGINLTLGRSQSIARHPTRLCSSAPQKAPKDTKITTFLQIVPEPVNTLNKLPRLILLLFLKQNRLAVSLKKVWKQQGFTWFKT